MPGWIWAIIVVAYLIGMFSTGALIEEYYPLKHHALALMTVEKFHPGAFFGMWIWPVVLPFVLMDKDARARHKERERKRIAPADACRARKEQSELDKS